MAQEVESPKEIVNITKAINILSDIMESFIEVSDETIS
jgi:hypothetical protein